MKLTKEDIKKYGTEKEQKILKEDNAWDNLETGPNPIYPSPEKDKNSIKHENAIGVMTNMVETGASSYWGNYYKITRRPEDEFIVSFVFKEDNEEMPSSHKPAKFVTITPEKVISAVNKLIKNPSEYHVHESYASSFIGDEWDDDADSDDILLQIIVLGDVIYG